MGVFLLQEMYRVLQHEDELQTPSGDITLQGRDL